MATPKLTSDLIADAQSEAQIGSDEDAFTDEQVLSYANRVLESEIVPQLVQLNVGIYDAVYTVAVASGGGEGASLYQIPYEAMGSLTSVHFLRDDGQEYFLRETTESAIAAWEQFRLSAASAGAEYFFIRGGRVGLHPNPGTGYLRIRYAAKPFPMTVDTTQYREVASVAQNGSDERITFVTASLPSGWADTSEFHTLASAPAHAVLDTLVAGNVDADAGGLLDVVQADNWPWSSATVRGLARAGDFVVCNRVSPIVQVPHEAYPALVARVAAELCRVTGDFQGASAATQVYADRFAMVKNALGDRTRNQSRVFVNRSSHIYLKGRRSFR